MRAPRWNAIAGTISVSSSGTAAEAPTVHVNVRSPATTASHTGQDMNANTARSPIRIAKPRSSCCCCMVLLSGA